MSSETEMTNPMPPNPPADSSSAASSPLSPKAPRQFTSASFRMSLSLKMSQSVAGSPREIYEECARIVNVCLGPGYGMQLLVLFCTVVDSLMRLSFGFAASALLLMYFGDLGTTASPKQISVALLMFALTTGVVTMCKTIALNHAGTWFMRRAKFAVAKMTDVNDTVDIMSHLAAARGIFINSWARSSSLMMTEVACIVVIGFYSAKLMGVAFGLFIVSLAFSVVDDFFLFRGQSKLATIAERITEVEKNPDQISAEDILEADSNQRFFHNYTSGTHTVVQLAHVMYSYVSPVLFFYVATSTSTSAEADGGIALSAALSSVIFYSLAVSCQIEQHGQTSRVIKNLYHAERVVQFDREHGGVFDYYVTNPDDATIPFSNHKRSGAFTTTHAEKAGAAFTSLFVVAIVLTSFILMGSTDLTCPTIQVTCSNVPADGSTVVLDFESFFTIRNGCSITDEIDDIVSKCAVAIAAGEVEAAANPFFFDDGVDNDDISAQIDAENDMQSAADATSVSQSTTVRVIEASFHGGQSTKRIQQSFKAKAASSDGGSRRSLSDSWDDVWDPEGDALVGDSGDFAPDFAGQYMVTIRVGDGRFDGTKSEITIQLVGTDGSTTDYMPIGKFPSAGATSTHWVQSLVDVGAIAKVNLISSGKDAVKFAAITVDDKYEGGMSAYLKCRGSKRAGTYNCEYGGGVSMTEVGADPNACMAECDPDLQDSPPDLTFIAPNFAATSATFANEEKLTYPFGYVWNSCVTNGASKFTYTAKCDTGCADRHGSFKLSPPSYFAAGNDGGCQQNNGNAYPSYCVNDPSGAEPWKMESSSSCDGDKIGHDRGHQIPANNFDDDETVCAQTNYMTNILPQSALMNRGAWLKTEMMVECWRNEVPITVIGGAVYMGDGSHGQSMPDEWGGHDRSDWFMESHNVKNPAFQWKVIITGAHGAYTDEDHIAFWMPNHESAKAANVNDYIISVDDLNAKLAAWGVPENIVLEHSATQYGEVWPDPAGCNRA